jgi:hypothetical protein
MHAAWLHCPDWLQDEQFEGVAGQVRGREQHLEDELNLHDEAGRVPRGTADAPSIHVSVEIFGGRLPDPSPHDTLFTT